MKNLAKTFCLIMLMMQGQLLAEETDDFFTLDDEEDQTPDVIYYNLVTLKVGYISEDNFVFSKYDDRYDKGGFITGDLFYTTGNAGDGNWTIEVSELGFDSRSVTLSYSAINNLRILVDYAESPITRNNTGFSAYTSDSQLTLPASWVTGVNTDEFNASQLTQRVSNDVLRRQLRVSINKLFDSGLRLGGSIDWEDKSGTMVRGLSIYSNAANPQAALLPAPVDQETTTFEFTAEFSNSRLAANARVQLTDFSNLDRVTWQNPYSSGLGALVDYPAGVGGYAPAPDYEMGSVTASAGYRLHDKIRITVDGMSSSTEQQEGLLDYTTLPGVVTTPLPVNALTAALDTNMFNVAVLTKPLARLSLNFSYRFNERDNQASRYAWQYVRGDSAQQSTSDLAIFNRPLSTTKERYKVEGKYRGTDRKRLSIAYERDETDRNYASVRETEEESVTIKVDLPQGARVKHRLELIGSNLAGSTYEWSRSYFLELATNLISQIPDDQRWSNHPLLRQYHLANQEKSTASWNTSFFINDNWVVQGSITGTDVLFDKSELGLTDVDSASANLNVSYTGDGYSSWLWVDANNDERVQMGRDFLGGINKAANRVFAPLPQGSDPTRNYQVIQDSDTVSAGLGMQWQISDRWSIETAYSYLRAEEEYEVTTFGARDLSSSEFPESRYELHHLTTELSHTLDSGLMLSVAHQYFRYTDTSWQYDNLQLGDVDKLLTLNQINPNEAVNMLSLSMSYRF